MLLSLALLAATAAASGDAQAQCYGQPGEIRAPRKGEFSSSEDEVSMNLGQQPGSSVWERGSTGRLSDNSDAGSLFSLTTVPSDFGSEGRAQETRLDAHRYRPGETEPSVSNESSIYTVEGRPRVSASSVDSTSGIIEIEGLGEGRGGERHNPQFPESPTGLSEPIELNEFERYPAIVYPAAAPAMQVFPRLEVDAERTFPRLSTPPASGIKVPKRLNPMEIDTARTVAEHDVMRKKQGKCSQKCLRCLASLGPAECLNTCCVWDCCNNCASMQVPYDRMSTLKKVICYAILWLICLMWLGAIIALIVIHPGT